MKIKRLLCAILSIALVMMSFPASVRAAEGAAIDIASKNITCVISYVTWDGENEDTKEAVAKVVDTGSETAKVLVAGLDYTTEFTNVGTDSHPIYEVTIKGIGDYTGSLIVKTETEGIIHTKGNWEFIELTANSEEDEDGYRYYECYITSFGITNPNVTSAKVNDYFTISGEDYDIYGVLPGTFMNMPSLQKVNLSDMDFRPYLFVNCPSLSDVVVEAVDAGYYLNEGIPAPMILGDFGTVNITADEEFSWCNDEDEDVYYMDDFCKLYGYRLITTSDSFQTGDWYYKVDTDYESAAVIGYKGTDKDVTIPQTIKYNGKVYDVDEIAEDSFKNLPNLETIDLGYIAPVNNMFSNCPSLKEITIRYTDSWDLDYTQPLVVENQALTIRAFPGVIAADSEVGSGDAAGYTVEDYCKKWGYALDAFKIDEIDLELWNNNSQGAIAGATTSLSATILSNDIYDNRVYATTLYPNLKFSDWSVYGDGKDYVTLETSDNGNMPTITTRVNVTEKMKFTVRCKVSLENEEAAGGIYTKWIETDFTLYPRVMVSDNKALYIGQNDYVPFTYVEYDNVDAFTGEIEVEEDAEEDEDFQEVEIDTEIDAEQMSQIDKSVFEANYEITSGPALISNIFSIEASEGAKEGDEVGLRGTFKYRGKEFVIDTKLNVIEGVQLDDKILKSIENLSLNSSEVTILCWENSDSYKLISSLLSAYPQLNDCVRLYDLDEDYGLDLGNGKDFYTDYYNAVKEEMDYEKEDSADIVIWPSYMAEEEMDTIASASMGTVSEVSNLNKTLFTYTLNYVKDNNVYAMPITTDQGAFLYRKDVAKKLFGTDDASEVQKHLTDWDELVQIAYDIKNDESKSSYCLLSTIDGLDDAVINATGLCNITDMENLVTLDTSVRTYYSLVRKFEQMNMIGDEEHSLGKFITLNGNENIDKNVYGICQGPVSYEGNKGEVATITKAHKDDDSAVIRDFILEQLLNSETNGKLQEFCNNRYGDVVKRVNNANWQNELWSNIGKNAVKADSNKDAISFIVQEELANNYTINQWKELTKKEDLESLDFEEMFKYFSEEYLANNELPKLGQGIPNVWTDEIVSSRENVIYAGDWTDTSWKFEAEEVDKEQLVKVIADTEKIIENVVVSKDGKDVSPTKSWLTQSEYDKYTEAINLAKEANRKYNTTSEMLNDAITKLENVCKTVVPKKGLMNLDQTLTEAVADAAPVDKTVKAVSGIKIGADFKKKTMKVSFESVAGAQQYRVLYKKSKAGTWSKLWTKSNNATIAKMSKNGLYQLKITAYKKVNGKWVRGDFSKTQYILYANTSIKKVSAKKKAAKVTYKKYKKGSGYQIAYSKNKKMTSSKIAKVKKAKTLSKTIKKLKKKKTYYFQVRPYKKSKGKTYVGIWSKAKKKKTK